MRIPWMIQHMRVPLAVHYRFLFGYTLGDPNDESTQPRLLKDTLRAFEEAKERGAVVGLSSL
jgi:hypothetical protein